MYTDQLMNKRFTDTELLELSAIFIPSIVTAAMTTIEAAALGREVSDQELDQLMDNVADAINDFLVKYYQRLREYDLQLSTTELKNISLSLQTRIYENAWSVIQLVTGELKQRCTEKTAIIAEKNLKLSI